MQLPTIEFASSSKTKASAIGTFWAQQIPEKSGKKGKSDSKDRPKSTVAPPTKGDKALQELHQKIKDSGHFMGKQNETTHLFFYPLADHPNVILVGLGPQKYRSSEKARQTGAALRMAQMRGQFAYVNLSMDGFLAKVSKNEANEYLQAFCEGYLLAGYAWEELKSSHFPRGNPVKGILLSGINKSAATDKAVQRARSVARATNFARSLGDRPGNYLTPTDFSKMLQGMAKEFGLKCTVFNKARIEKERMGLLLGVSQGSEEEPRFVILEHQGGRKSDRPIILVGKGVTFDAGGISLKPAMKMEEMKYDMMGAATVSGVMQLVAALKLKVNVTAYIAMTENMPDGKAQKPGDVVKSFSGKTVEIINTDAEGRLIMADTIEYAQQAHPSAQAIVDYATLTGAVLVALGSKYSGIMGNHKGFLERFKQSAKASGEPVWELPLDSYFDEFMKSPVADIKNSSDVREAGSSKGGTFLKHFVDPKIPWIHCDIAGTAWHRRDVNYHPRKFGSGALIRLTAHLLENWKSLK